MFVSHLYLGEGFSMILQLEFHVHLRGGCFDEEIVNVRFNISTGEKKKKKIPLVGIVLF